MRCPSRISLARRSSPRGRLKTRPYRRRTVAPSDRRSCEQLGLKLDPRRATVDVLVIDSVEKPSEN